MANKRKSVSETIVEAPAEQTSQRTAYRAGITGKRNRLTVRGKDSKFVYRFVNDTDDNVLAKQERGYEFVTHDVKVGDKRVATPQAEGSPVQQKVGGGQTAYLMRIRRDWYDEDKKAKAKEVDDIEHAFMGKGNAGDYGSVKLEHKTDGQAIIDSNYDHTPKA